MSKYKRNINYGTIIIRVTTIHPKKKNAIITISLESVYTGDTVEEIDSLPNANNLKEIVRKRLKLKINQEVTILKVEKKVNLGKTNYEL